jgi:hypothetical protein
VPHERDAHGFDPAPGLVRIVRKRCNEGYAHVDRGGRLTHMMPRRNTAGSLRVLRRDAGSWWLEAESFTLRAAPIMDQMLLGVTCRQSG